MIKSANIDPLLYWDDLHAFGIEYNRNHLRKLWNAGKFPKPTYITERRFGWKQSVIEAWIEERVRLSSRPAEPAQADAA